MLGKFLATLGVLIERIVIAQEGRAKHNDHVNRTGSSPAYYGLNFFAPVSSFWSSFSPQEYQHLSRSALGYGLNAFLISGRGQETFGEDPFLTGELTVALVDGSVTT